MEQQWSDLLFAHWPVPTENLRPLVPPVLLLDTYEDRCWVGVTPFYLSGLRARGLPALPGIASFPELNVRTYVSRDGKPGVFFFSLDAGSLAAVFGARSLYGLPYFYARMRVRRDGGDVAYSCRRSHLGKVAEFEARYRPISPPRQPQPATLRHFLTERYCLYTVSGRHLYRDQIHHLPWPLQEDEAEIPRNTMAAAAGITLPATAPLLYFARHLRVLVWARERLC
jgi:uncharacterized protein YqjF (DUF2071 family)